MTRYIQRSLSGQGGHHVRTHSGHTDGKPFATLALPLVADLARQYSAAMESRIEVSSGIGAVRMLGDFQRGGDVYTSSRNAGATSRADLQIDGGIGQITVEQAGR